MESRRKTLNLSFKEILSGIALVLAMLFIGTDKEPMIESISQTFHSAQAQETATVQSD